MAIHEILSTVVDVLELFKATLASPPSCKRDTEPLSTPDLSEMVNEREEREGREPRG